MHAQTPDTNSPWLTVTEACDIAKVGPKTIYREVKAGRLRAARIGELTARRDRAQATLDAHVKQAEALLSVTT